MQAAFVSLDEDINSRAKEDDATSVDLAAAVSGSCAIVAHIRHHHLHIANVGDSSAVLGTKKALLKILFALLL